MPGTEWTTAQSPSRSSTAFMLIYIKLLKFHLKGSKISAAENPENQRRTNVI